MESLVCGEMLKMVSWVANPGLEVHRRDSRKTGLGSRETGNKEGPWKPWKWSFPDKEGTQLSPRGAQIGHGESHHWQCPECRENRISRTTWKPVAPALGTHHKRANRPVQFTTVWFREVLSPHWVAVAHQEYQVFPNPIWSARYWIWYLLYDSWSPVQPTSTSRAMTMNNSCSSEKKAKR